MLVQIAAKALRNKQGLQLASRSIRSCGITTNNSVTVSPTPSSSLIGCGVKILLRNSSTAATFAKAAEPSTTTSTIDDVLVELVFVDPKGARRKIKGLVGQTLLQTATMHDIDLGPHSIGGVIQARRSDTWVEPLYGEGATSGFDHVVLVGNGIDTGPEKTQQEQDMIDLYWDYDDVYDNSRLACCVVLTKEMNGMTVYVPDRIVDDYH